MLARKFVNGICCGSFIWFPFGGFRKRRSNAVFGIGFHDAAAIVSVSWHTLTWKSKKIRGSFDVAVSPERFRPVVFVRQLDSPRKLRQSELLPPAATLPVAFRRQAPNFL